VHMQWFVREPEALEPQDDVIVFPGEATFAQASIQAAAAASTAVVASTATAAERLSCTCVAPRRWALPPSASCSSSSQTKPTATCCSGKWGLHILPASMYQPPSVYHPAWPWTLVQPWLMCCRMQEVESSRDAQLIDRTNTMLQEAMSECGRAAEEHNVMSQACPQVYMSATSMEQPTARHRTSCA
jgi:hypothetical protein